MIEVIPWKDWLFIHDSDGHRVLLDTEELHITAHMLENGVWEPQVRDVFLQTLYHGATYVDVGANIGLHALYAGGLIGGATTGGQMFLFEPNERVNDILVNNLELNGFLPMAKVFKSAVSYFLGETKFYVYKNHPGMSGMMSTNSDCPLAKRYEKNVPTVTLDSVLYNHSIDLLKIDVEGFELDVLKGAIGCIDQNRDRITVIIEWNPLDISERNGADACLETLNLFEERKFDCYLARFTKPLRKMAWTSKEEILKAEMCDLIFSRKILNAVE